MKIRQISIKNFRGISNATIDFSNFTTLIGPNNIGKSTILQAIHILLDNKKPKKEDWPGQSPSKDAMAISCIFHQLEDWEKRKSAISGLLYGDELHVKVECVGTEDDSEFSTKYFVYHEREYVPILEGGWTNVKKVPELKGILKDLAIEKAETFYEKKQEIASRYLTENPDALVRELEWHEKKFANSLQQAVPHVMYVPATFKIEDDLKSSSSSPFAFLFSNRLFPAVRKDSTYQAYLKHTHELQKKLQGRSEDGEVIEELDQALAKLSGTLNSILDFDCSVRLNFGDVDVEPVFMKAASMIINEEVETSLNCQGSGVQRALAFSLLESNAEITSSESGDNRTIVVLFEEPELYIHPHLMRRLKSTLQNRASHPNWQVICSTHSPFLIDIGNEPESLKLIKRGDGNSREVYQITSDLFMQDKEYDERAFLRAALDFHPTVSECFFAKRAILVEGDTEVAVLNMASELCKVFGIDTSLVSDSTVISAGGKWPLVSLARILRHLKIDFRIIHDIDRKNRTADELKSLPGFHPYNANKKIQEAAGGEKNIFQVDDTFEHVIWDKTDIDQIKDTEKPYNAWARIKSFLKDPRVLSTPQQARLRNILEFAYGDQADVVDSNQQPVSQAIGILHLPSIIDVKNPSVPNSDDNSPS